MYSATSNMSLLLTDPTFNKSLTSMFYIHGWRENFITNSTQTVVNAYKKLNTQNIVVIDWSYYNPAGGDYGAAVNNMITIGRLLGPSFGAASKQSLISLNRTHIVGFSLGAHMAGLIGKTVDKGLKIQR